jgi:cell division protein FtsB
MHWLNRLLLVALVVGLAVWGPEQLELARGTDDLARVSAERDELAAGNATLHEEIRQLRAEVRALKTDPHEIARIAREDLNLVAPGEVVFDVEHVAPPPRKAAAKP